MLVLVVEALEETKLELVVELHSLSSVYLPSSLLLFPSLPPSFPSSSFDHASVLDARRRAARFSALDRRARRLLNWGEEQRTT